MINLKELEFIYAADDWRDTFVGIKKSSSTGKFEFQLPKGFEGFPTKSFPLVKQLFFQTYKSYRKFFHSCVGNDAYRQEDGLNDSAASYTMDLSDGNPITYSKLGMLDGILESYNELAILTTINKQSRTSDVNYTELSKYLHKAIFLEEDTVFVEEMEAPRKIIGEDSPTIVEMFCFIYSEIKEALEEPVESERVLSLKNRFKENHLHWDSSIFEENSFDDTITLLKDVLDQIERTVAYKDTDYWDFYNAIYSFLYGENQMEVGEDGVIWGLSNFTALWEDMCFYDAKMALSPTQLLYADRPAKGARAYNQFESPFYVQINSNFEYRRKLRPDLVYTTFTGEVGMEHLERIYTIVSDPVSGSISIVPRYEGHSFNKIDSIYRRYAISNPVDLRDESAKRNLSIRAIDKAGFLKEVNAYFSSFKRIIDLMRSRPCIFDFILVDYKYIAQATCQALCLSEGREIDIRKQLVYEFSLQLNYLGCKTFSEFWIPFYFQDHEKDFEVVENPHQLFSDSMIVVYRRNFFKLQANYINGYA